MRCLFASPLIAGEPTPKAEAAVTKNEGAMVIMMLSEDVAADGGAIARAAATCPARKA
jgi:hypothetical protein